MGWSIVNGVIASDTIIVSRITVMITLILYSLAASALFARTDEPDLHPLTDPLSTGYLEVSEKHSLFWEVRGTERGFPVIVLHGGPGGGAWPDMARFFDPSKFRIILFDQRGAGRSKPKGEWRENTTQLLIEDINSLRDHLGVKGKALLFGGSWGTTLAVAYAEAHPDKVSGLVLRGVFLGSRAEIDHFYHGGVAKFFPENFARLRAILPAPERKDYPRQLFDMTQSKDQDVCKRAIEGWAYYEIRMSSLNMTDERCAEIVTKYDMTAFSVLENHYMMNHCFLDEGQLLENAEKIAHIPAFIVNGRFDVICPPITARALADRLKTVKLELTAAGHAQSEPPTTEALLRGVEWVAERMKP
jgi:proline iminopeptidase